MFAQPPDGRLASHFEAPVRLTWRMERHTAARLTLGKTAMVLMWSSGYVVGALAPRHAGALTVLS